ncbi:hypothetical protein N7462_000612 [Penicillium macrosclerotiorum]|uniref:uncharacterized protein n=1 Tax=Penicillium macrosclerotiorum TaxID=303699 RepID=UPI002549B439|nr:uncharacterized protein N7462_000612 [Penicillium macrosclerotiorum]KAJ5698607.1 hypothetical protein N7462_000612 [Penicillium macrosclerotiorum]
MTYLKDVYQRFLANPRNAPVAANASLIYVPTTTKIDGADAISTHVARQSSVVKKKSDQVINAIESSDALCLDIETTLEFLEGGGAYLPSLDDNFLADRVVTFPTPQSNACRRSLQVHIVHFNAESQINQVRIYWDQGSLLKEVEVIGARGRQWPIREAKEQVRLLRTSATARSEAPALAPSQDGNGDLPPRPSSPGKRHIKDPYAADSLFDLLSPNKADAARDQDVDAPLRSSSPGKRHTKDPYAAGSLTELLSPSKDTSAPLRPYAPSAAQPAPRQYGELFVGDEEPGTPSKPEKVVAPKAGSKFQGSLIFQGEPLDDDRAPYKSDPKKFHHFEIGADNTKLELKEEPKRGKSRHQSQWDFSDFATPQKPVRNQTAEEARHFGYSDAEAESPPARPPVFKPRKDAEVHFEMADEMKDGDDGRIISSFQGRGQHLYENRLFDENGVAVPTEAEEKQQEPLSVVGNNANRKKDFDPHWEMTDASPTASKSGSETSKPISSDRVKAVKMMESSWDNFDLSPEPIRTATSLHNPLAHNQPTWTLGDDE